MKIITMSKIYPSGNKIELKQDSRYKTIIDVYENGKFAGIICMSDMVKLARAK